MVAVSSLCVGKELLVGRTVNTNAHWLGARLLAAGTMLDRILTVTDSIDEIASGLNELLSRKPDFVIVIGGLGPTPDDMTLKAVATSMGRRVRLSHKALEMVKGHYSRNGREFVLTPARKKMAMIPEGSMPLLNGIGTAPGVRFVRGGSVVFCLPGVPREMKDIYKRSIRREIRDKVGVFHTSKVALHLSGVFESALTPAIAEAVRRYPRAYIKSHPKGVRAGKASLEIDIVVTAPRKADSMSACEEIALFFSKRVGEAGGRVLARSAR